MNQVLLTLGGLTLGGSAAVLLLAFAGRSVRGRYGARWRCWAWLLLCLRLAVPVPLLPQAQSGAPIRVDVPTPPPAVQPVQPPAGSDPGDLSTAEPVQPVQPVRPVQPVQPVRPVQPATPEPEPSLSLAQVLMTVWLAGAAAALLWSGWAHLRFLSYLRRWAAPVTDGEAIRAFNQMGDRLNLHRRPRLLVCQGLKVPMLTGLLRPAILLPQEGVSGEALGFSLLHELTHYRRRDIWLKTLAMWANALHWFNPLAWYMVRLVERDTELACDEDALRRLPPEDFAAYGQTILDAVARLQSRAD